MFESIITNWVVVLRGIEGGDALKLRRFLRKSLFVHFSTGITEQQMPMLRIR